MTAPDPGTQNSTEGQPNTDSGAGNGGTDDGLSPEALRAELKRARDDAAKYRQRAREFGDDEQYRRAKDAVAAVEKAEQEKKSEVEKLTEAKEGLLHRASSAETDLLKLRVALGAGVAPSQVDEFASRLRGDDEDALKKDAEQLAKFFNSSGTQQTTRRGDPSQGAGGDKATTSDPIQAALEDKLGIG